MNLILLGFFSVALCLDVFVSYEPLSSEFVLNGYRSPNVQCSIGDKVVFTINTPVPFVIWATWPDGLSRVWSNGTKFGSLILPCDTGTGIISLSYGPVSSNSTNLICVGFACEAAVCPNSVCWDSASNEDISGWSDLDVANYIYALSDDFTLAVDSFAFVLDFAFVGEPTQYFSEAFNSTYSAIPVNLTTASTISWSETAGNITQIFSDQTGIPNDWFILGADNETGFLYIFPPIVLPPGGDVEVLFFESAYPRCNIHTTTVHPEDFWNIVGEYTHQNHIQEQACVAGINEWWEYISVGIWKNRTGGWYTVGCDQYCRYCSVAGVFKGDDCVCHEDEGGTFHCLSVKYAGAGSLVASFYVFIGLIFLVLA